MDKSKYYICRGTCHCFGTIKDEKGARDYENDKMFLEKYSLKNGKELSCSADIKALAPDCCTVVLNVPVNLFFDEYGRISFVEEIETDQ